MQQALTAAALIIQHNTTSLEEDAERAYDYAAYHHSDARGRYVERSSFGIKQSEVRNPQHAHKSDDVCQYDPDNAQAFLHVYSDPPERVVELPENELFKYTRAPCTPPEACSATT